MKWYRLTIMVMVWFSLIPFSSADDSIGQGMSIGLLIPFNTVQGDFDGETIVTRTDEELYLPEVEDNLGYGISLGISKIDRKGNWDLELSYFRSKHDVTYQSSTGDNTTGEAFYSRLALDLKRYFRLNRRFQPFILIGWIPYAELEVKNASMTILNSMTPESQQVGDASFKNEGLGANIGCGMAVNLSRNMALHAGVTYRVDVFSSARGARGDYESIENENEFENFLQSDTVNFQCSLQFLFSDDDFARYF